MIEQFTEGQVGAFTQLNEMFDTLRAYFLFTRNPKRSIGFTLWINGGVRAGVTYPDTDPATAAALTLAPSVTSYVEANPTTGAITANTSGFTSGRWAIGRAITNTEGVVTWLQDFTIASTLTP